MVYGFVFEKLPWGGHGVPRQTAPSAPPLSGSLKPTENRFFELLAASWSFAFGCFLELPGAPGSPWNRFELPGNGFLSIVDANLAPTCLPKPTKIA